MTPDGGCVPILYYSSEYFDAHQQGSLQSARAVLPHAFRVLARRPSSVIDIGCGVGAWLAACREIGVQHLHGVDGAYVDRQKLMIPAEDFLAADLARPLAAGRAYDLAISVEVAEHLPAERAAGFVADVTAQAPVVLFSAAIPGQESEGHVNCQWPAYWIELFARHGYRVLDALRPLVWDDPCVKWWYAQNLLLFIKEGSPGGAWAGEDWRGRSLVHPGLHLESRVR